MSTEQSGPEHRRKEILKPLWHKHYSVSAVARELDVSPQTVSKWLDRHGIREQKEGSLPLKIQLGKIDVDEIDSFAELARLQEEHR